MNESAEQGSHTHVLADYDNGYVLVVYSKSNVINWIKILDSIQKGL